MVWLKTVARVWVGTIAPDISLSQVSVKKTGYIFHPDNNIKVMQNKILHSCRGLVCLPNLTHHNHFGWRDLQLQKPHGWPERTSGGDAKLYIITVEMVSELGGEKIQGFGKPYPCFYKLVDNVL